MGVRRASLEARGKSAPFTRVPLPWARAGSWQAHQLLFVWVASARLADGGHVSAQRRRGLPSARRSKWNPPLGGLLSSLRGGSGYGWSICSA